MPKDDKPIYAKNYLVNKWKLSPVVAAGIVGNLQGESGLNTKALGDNGTSYGIAQWHKERRTALNNFARKQNKDVSHLDTQLDYLVYELNTTEKKALNKINLAKTPEQAAIAFMNHFERPAEWAKKESVGKRVLYAKSIFGDKSPTAKNINYKEDSTEYVPEEDNSFFKNYVPPQEQQFSNNLPQVDESTTEPSKQFKSDLAKDRIVQKEKEQKLIEELSQIFKQEEQVQQEPQQAQQLDPNLYQVYDVQHPELETPQFQEGGLKKEPTLVDMFISKVNPENWGLNSYNDLSFNKAFDKARKNVDKNFLWNTERYSTKTQLTPKQQLDKYGIPDAQVTGNSSIRDSWAKNLKPDASLLGMAGNMGVPITGGLMGIIGLFMGESGKQVDYDRLKLHLSDSEYQKYLDNIPDKFIKDFYKNSSISLAEARKKYSKMSSENRAYTSQIEDIYQLYLGKPQKYNSVGISNYKPSIGNDKKEFYYSLPKISSNRELIKKLYDNVSKGEITGDANNPKVGDVVGKGKSSYNVMLPSLGTATVSIAEDEKGRYLSYYDDWDVTITGGSGSGGRDSTGGIGKPLSIYDRVYIDKDGYPISKKL